MEEGWHSGLTHGQSFGYKVNKALKYISVGNVYYVFRTTPDGMRKAKNLEEYPRPPSTWDSFRRQDLLR